MELRELKYADYPAGLLEIPQPPEKLWIRGSMPETGTKLLAVVGSRALTAYGREACTLLMEGLRGYPISVVSGLALGADACAHRAALSAGLHTIAIPGSDLSDSAIYPKTNLGLAMQILEAGGALISENEPAHKPRLKEFPSRNRLMVGMCDAVLMIEAGSKSGTLITARLASDYNRELLCVPHRIGDTHSFGSHLFLRLGATMVSDPLHILEALHIDPRKSEAAAASDLNLEGNEKLVYEILQDPLSRDEVIRRTKLPAHEALAALVTLELKGVLKEEFGSWKRL